MIAMFETKGPIGLNDTKTYINWRAPYFHKRLHSSLCNIEISSAEARPLVHRRTRVYKKQYQYHGYYRSKWSKFELLSVGPFRPDEAGHSFYLFFLPRHVCLKIRWKGAAWYIQSITMPYHVRNLVCCYWLLNHWLPTMPCRGTKSRFNNVVNILVHYIWSSKWLPGFYGLPTMPCRGTKSRFSNIVKIVVYLYFKMIPRHNIPLLEDKLPHSFRHA